MPLADYIALGSLIRDISKEIDPNTGTVPPANKELLKILERIYFSRDGIFDILDRIIEGRKIDEKAAQRALLDFNDYEGHLVGDLDRLSENVTRKNKALGIRDRRMLDLIKWRKIDARREAQYLLNRALTYDEKIPLRRAESLRETLSFLNAMIEDADERLRGKA